MATPRRRKDDNVLAHLIRYLPIIAVLVAAVFAHAQTEVQVEANSRQIARFEESFRGWLERVEAKLDRAIEREAAR